MNNFETVYFVRHKGTKPVKIGYSSENRLERRITELDSVSPFGIELVGRIRCAKNDGRITEKFLHAKYKLYRIRGEWFEMPEEEINRIIKALTI